MKQHLEEQNERLRQQLEEQAVELMVKEKELKKIKFNQLLIDTQATFMQEATMGLNTGVRHSGTVHGPRASDELSAGGNEDGKEGQSKGADGTVAKEGAAAPDAPKQEGAGVASQADKTSAEARSPDGRAPPQPQAEGSGIAGREESNKSRS